MARKTGPIELAEGVWWVGCGGWGGTPRISEPGDANVFLVDCGGAAALIDAGGHDRAPEILANIARAGVAPKRVKAIFLTHAHHDHSAGAGWLRGRTGARVYAGQLTARALAEREPLLIGAMKPFAKPRFRRMAADRLASALPASPRPLSISPTRPATDFPSSRAISDNTRQNSSSSEMLVRWRAMVSERLFLGLAMI